MSRLLTRDEYILLVSVETSIDIESDGQIELHEVLNESGLCNFTVCPECMIDDFIHVEGCSIREEIING